VKRYIQLFATVLILAAMFPAAVAQEEKKACEFSIVGTWQSTTSGHANPTRLRFDRNGTATVPGIFRNGRQRIHRISGWTIQKHRRAFICGPVAILTR
jgi:hypothetical protein